MVIPIVLEVHISENETSETEFSKSFGIKFITQFPSKLQPLKVWDWIFLAPSPSQTFLTYRLHIATIFLNGQIPWISLFFSVQKSHSGDNFLLARPGSIISPPIDKANKIGRPNAQVYRLTPSELDFRAD